MAFWRGTVTYATGISKKNVLPARRTLDPDAAAMGLDDALDDGQS